MVQKYRIVLDLRYGLEDFSYRVKVGNSSQVLVPSSSASKPGTVNQAPLNSLTFSINTYLFLLHNISCHNYVRMHELAETGDKGKGRRIWILTD
jgi:hypothetical protein